MATQNSNDNLTVPFTFNSNGPWPSMNGLMINVTSNNLTHSMNMNAAVFLMPMFCDLNYTLSALGCYVVAALAASTATLGIYASEVGGFRRPTGAALAAGSVATTATGLKQVVTTTKLNTNTLYWLAIQVSSNTTLSFQINQGNVSGTLFPIITVGTGYTPGILTYTNTYSVGTLPSITPASLNFTSTIGGFYPMISWI